MQLHDKIQYVLDESRILILGAQVLVGFHYRAAFERGFQHLPETSQALLLGALGLTGDCFVVVRKVTGTLTWALIGASLLLIVCSSLWFGVTLYGANPRTKR